MIIAFIDKELIVYKIKIYILLIRRIIRDLKIEAFRHFMLTANVNKSRDQGLAVRFVVWGSCLYKARPRSQGKLFTAGFLDPRTSQSHVWEEIKLFRTLLLIDYRILFRKT